MLWSTLAPHLHVSFHNCVDFLHDGGIGAFRSSDHIAAFQSKTWSKSKTGKRTAFETCPRLPPSGYAQWSSAPVLYYLCFVNLFVSDATRTTRDNKSTSSHLPKPWWLEGSASMAALVSCWCLQYSFDTEDMTCDMNILTHFLPVFDAQCPTLQPFIWLRTWRFIKSTTQTPLVSSTLDERQQGLSSRFTMLTMLALIHDEHDERNVSRA